MDKLVSRLFLFCGIIAIISCKDVFEEDLEGKIVKIISPPDSLRTSQVLQTFWWEEIEESESYRIQIVKGTFNFPLEFVSDSLVYGDKFSKSLLPGDYQWRIRPENTTSFGSFITRTLFIDSTLDLSNQTVLLVSPANNFVTNNSSLTFEWQKLYNATEYRFQLIDIGNGSVIEDEVTTNDTISFSLVEGDYQWQVRAQNNISLSNYSSRLFTIDQTAPATPYNLLPFNNSFINNGDTLFWSADSSSIGDSIYISTDTLFISPSPLKLYTTNNFYPVNLSSAAYFWKVKSLDAANNESSFSATQKFIVQ
ncbi:MAG TPA: hypothetical protein PKN75_12675 [Bacteroidia bacterium]|nr:hypothetical protein [Bacteroidia bacterium]